MGNYRIEYILPSATGLPEDGIVTTWHVKGPAAGPDAGEYTNAEIAIRDFFEGLHPLMPDGVISTAANAGIMKAYEVDMNTPGAGDDTLLLLDTDTFTVGALAAAANPPLPNEVAVCMSMIAVGAADVPERIAGGDPGPAGDLRPRSRYRGRVYLGPWASSATTIGIAAGSSRPGAGLRTAILNYGEALVDDLVANGLNLCVYSRADAAFKTVDTLYVDDAFDTVRSRGCERTLRETRVVIP